MQDLILCTHYEYLGLRQALQEAGLDLCYTVQAVRTIRLRWSPERLHDAALWREVARRRPADPSFRIASIAVSRPGSRVLPDKLTVTFHAVGTTQDDALKDYLATHAVGTTWQDSYEDVADEEAHATPKTYVQVALLLAFMTAVEVSAFYLPGSMRPPRWALMIVLVLLSACKFWIVASFFMHLRYDHRIYAGCFVGGLVVATGTLFALLALFHEASNLPMSVAPAEARPIPHAAPPPPTTAPPVVTGPALQGGDAAAGQQVFHKLGCGACHVVANLPEARGTIGPALDGLSQRAASRIPGISGPDYIRQSIEAPGDYVVKGYMKLMPPLRGSMSDQEFADLLAWLATL